MCGQQLVQASASLDDHRRHSLCSDCRQLRCVWKESTEEQIQTQIQNNFRRGFNTSRNIKYNFNIWGILYPLQGISCSVARQAIHVDFCLDVLQPQHRVAFAYLLWLLLLSICFLTLYFFGIFFFQLCFTQRRLWARPLRVHPSLPLKGFALKSYSKREMICRCSCCRCSGFAFRVYFVGLCGNFSIAMNIWSR